ncbi:hypothetical protein GCM10023321_80700 [Pseudonocardia eucalypti]|uniref:LysM domain-containing protein n=1 Tax=Pseudonocardia eucalypti TaxID=648755 RepID=A0ABP9RDR8_9PSEU|nr:LysM repeat protein [Pseudonocardia eucalypti]
MNIVLNKTFGAVLAVRRFLDRNFVRILKYGALGLLVALLVIGQVNSMTYTDTSAAAARPSTNATAPKAPAAPAPAAAAPASGGSATYQVAAGDTLAGVAMRHRVGYRQIAAANGITDPNRITPGQRLAIPPAAPGTVLIAPGDTLTAHAARARLTVAQVRALNPQVHDPDLIMAGDQLRLRP